MVHAVLGGIVRANRYDPKLDFGPLKRFVEGRGGRFAVMGRDDSWQSSWHRWMTSGKIPLWSADEFCVKVLGVPPELIWGDDFFM